MTELAVPNSTGALEVGPADDQVARLVSWAETARAAHQIATSLCKTTFVPDHYKDKPHEGAAAILAGAELGIPGPLAALRAFHPINGTPTLSAMAMRAITQAHGHEVRIVHSDATRAEVAVRRKGSTDWQSVVWTIERAEQAGLVGGRNVNWKKNPTAMLIARATSEGCRWVASDALMGMPYSAEEMQDEVGLSSPAPAAPVARRLSVADLDKPAAVEAPARNVRPAGPDLHLHDEHQTARMLATIGQMYVPGKAESQPITEYCGFGTPDGPCNLPAGHATGPELDGYDGHDVVPTEARP
jgi:hypothetical protein